MTRKTLPLYLTAALLSARVCNAAPALTIYNQKFAVVRDTIHLDLKSGVNDVSYSGATMHLEPDSVVLRDPTGKRNLQILEQNFRADPITESLLLNFYEGKTIDFEKDLHGRDEGKTEIVHGKIIRSGYVPHPQPYSRYGEEYAQGQSAAVQAGQPIIEVDGKLMFRLPGTPLFPALGDNTILKPTLTWQLQSDSAGTVDAELGYVTGGMSWSADYNLVMPENGDTIDLVGWVTMDNQSGKSFENAKIKLMAGDVSKINEGEVRTRFFAMAKAEAAGPPPVTEKAFDEYHLYTLQRSTTLLDRETKQVEFVSADGIKSQPIYVYDGAKIDQYRGWDPMSVRNDREYGTQSNPKVWVMREFKNSKQNNLGMPLPKGRLRFYRRDADGQMEFVGENTIDHTPADEMIRVATGSAFDVVGERKRTDYKMDNRAHTMDETFEIKLRNHKKAAVTVRVVEHLYRWSTWQISDKSTDFKKTDAQSIEFPVKVAPDAEETVTYTVHYSW